MRITHREFVTGVPVRHHRYRESNLATLILIRERLKIVSDEILLFKNINTTYYEWPELHQWLSGTTVCGLEDHWYHIVNDFIDAKKEGFYYSQLLVFRNGYVFWGCLLPFWFGWRERREDGLMWDNNYLMSFVSLELDCEESIIE